MVSNVPIQAHTANETGCEALVFAVKFAFLVEVIEKHVIVSHPVGCSLDTGLQPVASKAAAKQVSTQCLAAKRKVGHHGEHQVVVAILGENWV